MLEVGKLYYSNSGVSGNVYEIIRLTGNTCTCICFGNDYEYYLEMDRALELFTTEAGKYHKEIYG
jgi:hypothetical protein